MPLQHEIVTRVSLGEEKAKEEPANVFEVVRKLGAGSYAVVYLVREVLSMGDAGDESCENDGADLDMSMDGHDRDEVCVFRREKGGPVYGKEYAVKLLSKVNLDEEALNAQMFEVRVLGIHSQSVLIPVYPLSGQDSPISSFTSEHCHATPDA